MARTDARGGQHRVVIDAVDCPKTATCGALRGQYCMTRSGNKLTTPHAARVAAAEKSLAVVHKAKLDVIAMDSETVPMVDEVTRAERLEIVLVGIQLARKVGATEEQVVRALVEMVVDGDGWVALF